jgi:CBS domain containing-hemolysin-like protein
VTAVLTTLLVLVLLIALNGLFTAAEFAIVAAPRTRIAQLAADGSRSAQRVLRVLHDPYRQGRYLATAQIGITAASLGLGMYGEHAVAGWLLGPLERLGHLAEPTAHAVATVLALTALTYLHVVLGEMIPKSLALQSAESTALALATPMRLLERLFAPVVTVLNGLGNAVTRLVGIPLADAHARLMSSEELELIVEESTEQGVIKPGDQLFIENIFDFSERTVGQVMTPRNRMVVLPADAGEAAVLATVCEARFSRYPVCGEDVDDIVGVLLVKDLARWQVSGGGAFDLSAIARPPSFVPETLGLEAVLTQLRRERGSIAIALDEFGGVAGLVTIEDIVEEIVGEILDEFDQEEITPLEDIGAGVVRARGDVILDELNQHYDLDLAHPEAETVAGLVMDALGRIAEVGDVVTYAGVTFEVERVAGHAIETVIVRLPSDGAPGDAAQPAGQARSTARD